METENFTAIDLQREYVRTLLAVRIAAAACVLLAAGWCWTRYEGLEAGLAIIENMVAGGIAALPSFSQAVFEHRSTLASVAALGGLGSLAWIWIRARSIAGVIYGGLTGVICCLLTGFGFETAAGGPLNKILAKFAA